MLENHRVIRQSLNDAEWDLVRVFVRKLDSNDIWMRFGRPLDLQQDFILKQFFDIRVGLGEIVWSPDGHGEIAGLLHRIRVSSSEAEIGLVVRSDLKRNGIGESLVRGTLDRSTRERLETLSCVILRENKPTLALARKIGFLPRSITAQSIQFEFKLYRAQAARDGPFAMVLPHPTRRSMWRWIAGAIRSMVPIWL
jgi:RimJ/RimL family protein N-acetyltransferase